MAASHNVPVHELLPPLTSSNAIDLQLYALVAVLIREYVQTWYTRITPDPGFVDEVVGVIAHCARALEQRTNSVNVQQLLLIEVPALFNAHVSAIRMASQAQETTNVHQVYHTLRPHPALSPIVKSSTDEATAEEQAENDAAYRRLLAQGVLAVLLPNEDLQNPCLFAMVSEVFADMILGTFVAGRMCENVFIFDAIQNASETVQARLQTKSWAVDSMMAPPKSPRSRLSKFGLVVEREQSSVRKDGFTIVQLGRALLQYVMLVVTGLRAMIAALAAATSLPRRTSYSGLEESKAASESVSRTAMLALPLWHTIAMLLDIDARMPWLSGLASLLQWLSMTGPGRVGAVDSRLDR